MKSLIHLNILCISLIYVYGQGHIGEHDHSHSDIHIDTSRQQGRQSDVLSDPLNDRPSGRNVKLNQKDKGLTKAILSSDIDRLLRKQSKQLSKVDRKPMDGFQRSQFGIIGDQSVLLTKGNNKENGRRGGRRRGRKRGGKRRSSTTTTTTTTTTAPKKSGGNSGITIIRTSRPNPFAAIGNVLRSALNIGNVGNAGPLGTFMRPAVVGRPLFGGLFGGKR